jgi:hypothetical protein
MHELSIFWLRAAAALYCCLLHAIRRWQAGAAVPIRHRSVPAGVTAPGGIRTGVAVPPVDNLRIGFGVRFSDRAGLPFVPGATSSQVWAFSCSR